MNDTYVVTLAPIGDHRNDPARRLALLLKFALRVCGLKCVCVREAPLTPTPSEGTKHE